VAGVVGQRKFAYDIWGDTVNTASRMESSGATGEVNISGRTFELIKDDFVCEYRGKVEAKNKGLIDMYFVRRLDPELAGRMRRERPPKGQSEVCTMCGEFCAVKTSQEAMALLRAKKR
ncbi:MAG TPA: phosphomethylpyrimidine synthase ThiC, partial [Acidobacteriota bacterium]|nr:phosphomethylpyrimidine synthase ThiC [Acidobacteriota bacterium]